MSDSRAAIRERKAHPSPMQIMWRKVRKNPVARAGFAILALLYGSALFAGFLAPYSYRTANRGRNFHPPMLWRVHLRDQSGAWSRPFVYGVRDEASEGRLVYAEDTSKRFPIRFFVRGDAYSILGLVRSNIHLFGVDPGGVFYPFGADQMGRDVYSRILYGGQVSLTVGLLGVAISLPLGLLVGGLAGYFGGRTDFVLMRVVETILAVPPLYLILTLRYTVGGAKIANQLSSAQTYYIIVAILACIYWAGLARVVRGMVLSIREREFVTAARALGKSNLGIIVQHVLPNTLSFVIVSVTISIPSYILGEVALSFLGVGVQEPSASWGNMLQSASEASNLAAYPWIILPGVFIFLTVLAFNFLGDGLRDAADPRMLAGK